MIRRNHKKLLVDITKFTYDTSLTTNPLLVALGISGG
jgi:hypothetical protein